MRVAFLAVSLGIVTSCLSHRTAGAADAPRPNILVILADDMGFSDIGCYGGEVATPNLDRLAANGLRFTNFYNTARCCPTRASLLTGLYPHQAGVGHMVEDQGVPGYRGRLNDRCATIAETLGDAAWRGGGAYHPMMVGKWHVGEQRPHWPVDRGFRRFFGLVSGGSNYWKLDGHRIMAEDDRRIQPYDTECAEDFYFTDAFTHYAVRFLDEHATSAKHADKPFFLYLAYTAPHWPLHARKKDIDKYRGRYMHGWDRLREERRRNMIELGLIDKDTPLSPRDGRVPAWDTLSEEQKRDWDLRMAVYAAQIDAMDRGIGQVLRKLDEQNQLDNTLILFLSDNGGCAEVIDQSEKKGTPPGSAEGFLSYGIGWANASNTPLRLYKHFVHEGGISTPLIVHWPRGIDAGRRGKWVKDPGHVIDIAATCLDVAGAKQPQSRDGKEILPLEGVSLLPALRGQPIRRGKPIFWEHEGNRAVRDGKWKLVAKGRRGPWELYDIDADRTESSDLAGSQPQRVKRMAEQWEQWALRTHTKPWPRPRQTPAAKARNAVKDVAKDVVKRAATAPPQAKPEPAEK